MKKPAIPETYGMATPGFVEAVRAQLEVVTGRRGDRSPLSTLNTLRISAAPTQSEVEMLRSALVGLIKRLEE